MQKFKLFIRNHPGIMRVCAAIYRFAGGNHLWNARHSVKQKYRGVFLRRSRITVQGTDNVIEIGEGCRIRNLTIHIYGNHNRVLIDHDCVAVDLDIWLEDDGNTVTVGEHTWFDGKCHLACTEGKTIQIGERCLFSSEIVFRTGDSHSILDFEGKRINPARDIAVGDHVWICNQVIVLKGTEIGSDCVVGAGSLLAGKEYEDGSLIAGNPAKVIRRQISWDSRKL